MTIFRYDKSFEGLLCAIFEAYTGKLFPEKLIAENEPPPLFVDHIISIATDKAKANRVWKGLEKKLTPGGLSFLTMTWLSELPEIDMLLFRYIRKALDSPQSIELNFGDPDILEVSKIWKKVSNEKERIIQFTRFQKTADNIFFAPIEPVHNVLSLVTRHFQDRFASQKWIIYDMKRDYGYFYDLSTVTEIHFENKPTSSSSGKLDEELLAEDEKIFQKLWKEYFKFITIKERLNPKLHRQHLPVRFWKYLTEKQ